MTLIDVDLWSKLLKMDFSLEVSTEFLKIADTQLSSIFEKETGLKVGHNMQINWSAREGFFIQGGIPVYSAVSNQVVKLENGRLSIYSKISAQLSFKYGRLNIFICWSSKTGLSYTLGSTGIDTDDIEFWIEGLDVEKCHSYINPDLANLIVWPDLFAADFQKKIDVGISIPFVECMNAQLTPIFENRTGLKVKNLISLYINKDYPFLYEKSEISKLSIALNVNSHISAIDILWKSKSKKIYGLQDGDIDCHDIEFWFGNLNIIEYHKQMNPYGYTLPFKLKDLSYRLIVNRIQIECYVTLTLKKEETDNADKYATEITSFIGMFNEKALATSKENGVVHNFSFSIKENIIDLQIDIGSAGADFFKKLFKYLSDLNVFDEVVVD
nr:hypothetical protein [Pedobacter sp. ASV2]